MRCSALVLSRDTLLELPLWPTRQTRPEFTLVRIPFNGAGSAAGRVPLTRNRIAEHIHENHIVKDFLTHFQTIGAATCTTPVGAGTTVQKLFFTIPPNVPQTSIFSDIRVIDRLMLELSWFNPGTGGGTPGEM